MKVSEIPKEQNRALYDYFQEVKDLFQEEKVFKKMISMFAATSSEEDILAVYLKYHNVRPAMRFGGYGEVESKVEVIKETTDALDYFGIEYPSPPEAIKQFFF